MTTLRAATIRFASTTKDLVLKKALLGVLKTSADEEKKEILCDVEVVLRVPLEVVVRDGVVSRWYDLTPGEIEKTLKNGRAKVVRTTTPDIKTVQFHLDHPKKMG